MHATVREVTDFTVHVLDSMVTPEFPAETVLALLRPAVDAPVAAFQHTHLPSGDTVNVSDGVGPEAVAAFIERSRVRWRENPLMVAAARGEMAPDSAERASGGRRQWRASPARDFLLDVAGCDQIATVLLHGGPTEICGLTFGRSGQDFATAHLDLMATVQPLLQAVDRHARAMQRWNRSLTMPLEKAETAVRDSGLTARQLEVLVLLADGLTATAMARRLGCSPRTVHKHVENLYRRLGVQDRVSAVLEGQRRNLLPRR